MLAHPHRLQRPSKSNQSVLRRRNGRLNRGTQLAEIGPTLWIVFVILLFPLIAFGTIGIRYVFLVNAARLSVSAGAQCKSFLADVNPPTDISATNAANKIVTQATSAFSGVSVTKTTCYIVASPLAGGTVTKQSTPLATAANTNLNAYDFEVVIQGNLQPVLPGGVKWFVQVPGLSVPLATTARADAYFENTQGLTQ